MCDDSDTQGVIKNVYVNHSQVRSAARKATDVGQRVSAGPVLTGASEAVAAVAGGEAAGAFTDVSHGLESRLAAFRVAVVGWADDVQAALAAYELEEEATAARLSQLDWRPV